ncbi:MAG: Fic family protein [Candidatus Babeliales bacterium]
MKPKKQPERKKSIVDRGILTLQQIEDHIIESNSIEKILRPPTVEEIAELDRFLDNEKITISELEKFVKVFQPDAKLRQDYGMNVRVGRYIPPYGGPQIRHGLDGLLNQQSKWSSHKMHVHYELLHPFSDGNGRSGRALWLWKRLSEQNMKNWTPFLLEFYYQTLREAGELYAQRDAMMNITSLENIKDV